MEKLRVLQIKISDNQGVSESKVHSPKANNCCATDIMSLSDLNRLSEYINKKLNERNKK